MSNKVVLVTGSNRGIGLAAIQEFLKLGYTAILTSRKETDGEKAMTGLEKYTGQVAYQQLDVTDPESVASAAASVRDRFGRLDVLVNNAGINYDSGQQASTVDLDDVQRTINTNTMGPWRTAQAFLPLLKKAPNGGRLINVSSGAGAIQGMGGGTPAYGISKATLNALTIKLAAENKSNGVLINAMCPGWVRTDMGGMGASRSPAKGAETIVWLAEAESGSATGRFFRDKQEISW